MSVVKNLSVERGMKFYKEIELYSNSVPKNLVGKKIICIIKESTATSQYLYYLTEANGGIVVLNDEQGKIAMYIPANATNIEPSYAIYAVIEQTETDTEGRENEKVLEGKIKFNGNYYVIPPEEETPVLPENGYFFSDDDVTQIYHTDDARTQVFSADDADLT